LIFGQYICKKFVIQKKKRGFFEEKSISGKRIKQAE
jgi:hypothetical protein